MYPIPPSTTSSPSTATSNSSTSAFDFSTFLLRRGFTEVAANNFIKTFGERWTEEIDDFQYAQLYMQEKLTGNDDVLYGKENPNREEDYDSLVNYYGLRPEIATMLVTAPKSSERPLYDQVFELILCKFDFPLPAGVLSRVWTDYRFEQRRYGSNNDKPSSFPVFIMENPSDNFDFPSLATVAAAAPAPNRQTYFHATSWEGAASILTYGIKLNAGLRDLDFGSNPSFYLNPSKSETLRWIQDLFSTKIERGAAIVIFSLPDGFMSNHTVVNLNSRPEDWSVTVAYSRNGEDVPERIGVDEADFVYGPQLKNARTVKKHAHDLEKAAALAKSHEPTQDQLAAKTRRATATLNQFRVGAVFVKSKQIPN